MAKLALARVPQPGDSLKVKQTEDNLGAVGNKINKIYKKRGYIASKSRPGVGINTSLKSRKIDAVSAVSLISMQVQEILCTDYDSTPLAEYLNNINLVTYDNSGQSAVVHDNQILNCTDSHIKKGFAEGYENIKHYLMRNGIDRKHIPGNSWLFAQADYTPPAPSLANDLFEVKSSTDSTEQLNTKIPTSIRFRFTDKTLKVLQSLNNNNTTFSDICV